MCDQSPTVVWNSFDIAGPSDRMPFHPADMLDDDFVPDWEDARFEDDAGQTGDWAGSPLFCDAEDGAPGPESIDSDGDERSFCNTASYIASAAAFGDDDCTLYTPSLGFSPASDFTSAPPTPFRVDDEPICDGRLITLAVSALPGLPHLFPPNWQGSPLTTPSLGLEVVDYDGIPLLADVQFGSGSLCREPSPFPIQLLYPSPTSRHPQASELRAPADLEPMVSADATHDYAAWGWGIASPT